MPSPLPPLHPGAPKPTVQHFLRPRQSSYYHPKCCGCSHNCGNAKHGKTEPATLPPPSIPPGLPRPSLKIKIPVKKGDNADKCPDQSKPLKFRISKPCSSADAEAKEDCSNLNLLKASHAKIEPAALPPPSIPPEIPRPSLKFKIPVKKGDNAIKCPDPSKPLKLRISKPCSSSADAAAKDCRNSTPATELSIIGENRKRKSAVAEKRPEFSLCLSKKEIEEDFLAMTSAKPPRRPTKRPKLVQDQLNGLFPGVYLSKRVTETQYKVRRSDLQ